MEAAATGSGLSGELLAHFQACASCRADFDETKKLFAAVDAGVGAVANAEIPASLLPRVRVRLSEQHVSRGFWVPVAAAISATVIILAMVFVRGRMRENSGTNSTALSTAAEPEYEKNSSAPAAIYSKMAPTETIRRKQSQLARIGNTRRRASVSVLVPSGQKEAVDKLLAELWTGAVKPDVLVVEKSEQGSEEPGLSPLAILPIEIKPLTDVNEESGTETETEKTNH